MELGPTFKGYIEDENDALLVLQATLDGRLRHIPRRPYEVERRYLIVSGSIFVFVEEISGIKRWTDGVSWSPSRISGKFLVYKELDKSVPVHPGSRKRGSGSPGSMGGNSESGAPGESGAPDESGASMPVPVGAAGTGDYDPSSLAPPPQLPSRYTGFVKKTMSVRIKTSQIAAAETLHIVSYYTLGDVHGGHLTRPTDSPYFAETRASPLLLVALENTSLGSHGKTCSNSNSSSSGTSSNSSPLVSGAAGVSSANGANGAKMAAPAAPAAPTDPPPSSASTPASLAAPPTTNNNTAGSTGERPEMLLLPPLQAMQPLPSLRIPSLTSMFKPDDHPHHHANFTRYAPPQPLLNPYLQGKFASPQPLPPSPPNLRYVSLSGCTYYNPTGPPTGGAYYPLPPVAAPTPTLAQVKNYSGAQPSAPRASAADAPADRAP